MTVAEVLIPLKTMKKISSFLEMGGAADVLADIEFKAATKAFQDVSLAKDKRIQIGVCIGHLNSSLEAQRAICANTESISRVLSQVTGAQRDRLNRASNKIRFLLCLLALCYVYLGEHELCLKHLDMAAIAEPWKTSRLGDVLFFAHLLSGPICLALNLLTKTSRYDPWDDDFYKLTYEDVQEIRTALTNLS